MDKILVQGGTPLRGEIKVRGSKNASLPIMAASLLTGEPVLIEGVPGLIDVRCMASVLQSLGARVIHDTSQETIRITAGSQLEQEPPADAVQRMRASFLVLGPLLARNKKVRLSLPGGCAIGTRPVDLHLKGLSAMGACFEMSGGLIEGETAGLKGARIYLDYPSVGATENILMAASLARGVSIVENAAVEPEIVDLANFLNSMGARISGAGTATVKIEGASELRGTAYTVIPDRIEAGTLLLAGAITGGDIIVENILGAHLKSLLAKMRDAGIYLEEVGPSKIRVRSGGELAITDIKTQPYPGFPTDLQPQFTALLSLANGTSLVSETVFENRFSYIDGLSAMGANIQVDGPKAIIKGQPYLTGAPVKAADLRGAAALLLAALAARGVTEIDQAVHLWRGYSALEERLVNLGASIQVSRATDCQAIVQG